MDQRHSGDAGELDAGTDTDTASTGPTNFTEFQIEVPPGALQLRAGAFGGEVVLEEVIEVPSEHWGYLDVTFHVGEDEVPRLEWRLSDMLLPFA